MKVEVNTECLMSARRRLAASGEDMDGTLARFQRDIDALGWRWGDDELGTAIEMVYQGALAKVVNCLVTNMDTADAYGERLADFAAAVDAGRQDAGRQFGGIAERSGLA